VTVRGEALAQQTNVLFIDMRATPFVRQVNARGEEIAAMHS
jgi:hypothetical protein